MGASVKPEQTGGSRIERNIAALRSQGATEHDVETYLTEHEGLTPEAPAASPRSPAYNALNTVSNALTFGVGQKFNALFNAAGDKISGRDSFTHSYDKNLVAEHEGLADFRAKHPIGSAVASGVGGGLGAVVAAPLAAAGEVGNALTLAQRAAAAAKTGGALGAIGATGNAPNTGGLLENTGRAALGGGVGALAGTVAAGGSQLAGIGTKKAGTLLQRVAASGPSSSVEVAPEADRASTLLLQRMDRAGITPQTALDRLAAAPENVPLTVMELAGDKSHPVRQLGKLVARTPSAGAANLRAAMNERAEPLSSAKAVLGDVGEAMGVNRTNLVEHGQQMSGQRLAAAKPHYDVADNAPPVPLDNRAGEDGPSLRDLLKRPSIKSAINFHNDVAAERGEAPLTLPSGEQKPPPIPPGFSPEQWAEVAKKANEKGVALPGHGEPSDVMPFEAMRQVKYKLDDMLGFAKTNGTLPDGTPATKAKIGAINDTRVAWLKIMADHEPEYAKANDIWSGESALQGAGKTGREFLSSPIDELQHEFGGMTTGEREQHNISALSGPMRDRIFKTDAVDRAKILSGPDMQERLQTVVPPEKMPALLRNSGYRHQIALTHQAIGGGSDTAENISNQFDASNSIPAKALASAATHGPKHAAVHLFQNALESQFAARLRGVNEETSNALAPMLTAGVKSRADATALMEALAEQFDRAARTRGSLPYAGTASGTATAALVARQR